MNIGHESRGRTTSTLRTEFPMTSVQREPNSSLPSLLQPAKTMDFDPAPFRTNSINAAFLPFFVFFTPSPQWYRREQNYWLGI